MGWLQTWNGVADRFQRRLKQGRKQLEVVCSDRPPVDSGGHCTRYRPPPLNSSRPLALPPPHSRSQVSGSHPQWSSEDRAARSEHPGSDLCLGCAPGARRQRASCDWMAGWGLDSAGCRGGWIQGQAVGRAPCCCPSWRRGGTLSCWGRPGPQSTADHSRGMAGAVRWAMRLQTGSWALDWWWKKRKFISQYPAWGKGVVSCLS